MNNIAITYNQHTWQIMLRDEADESVVAEIFKWREYRVIEELVKNCTSPVIDVGAHAGFFTLLIRSLNSYIPVIAIEPEKNNIAQLKKHLVINKVNKVMIEESALAFQTGKRNLSLSQDSHNHKLLPKLQLANTNNRVEQVSAISFSDLLSKYRLERVSLLKMDIEGGEYEVFENLEPSEFTKIGSIFLEYHAIAGLNYKHLEGILRQNGFSVQIFPSHFDKTMGFIWAKNKRSLKSLL